MRSRISLLTLLMMVSLSGGVPAAAIPAVSTPLAALTDSSAPQADTPFMAQLTVSNIHRGDQPAFATVTYRNVGDAPVPAPLFTVYTDPATILKSTCDGWRPGVLQLLGVSPSGPAGTLPPQQSNRLPVLFKGLGYNLGFRMETNQASIMVVDWNSQKDLLQPGWIKDSQWESIWPMLQVRLGTTWSDYLQVLGRNAERLRQRRQTNHCVRDLVNLEVRAALDLPTAAVAGVLQHVESGDPLPDISVIAYRDDGQVIRSTTTDLLDGGFVIPDLPSGHYQLHAEGYYFDPPVTVDIIDDRDVTDLVLQGIPVPEPEDIPEVPDPEIPDYRPTLATGEDGDVHLVWQRGDQLWHAVYNGEVFTATQPISGAVGTAPALASGTQLVGGTDPGLALVWQADFGNEAHLEYALGQPTMDNFYWWSEPMTLTGDSYGDTAPSVAVVEGDTPLVLWLQRDWEQNDDLDLYYAVISPAQQASAAWTLAGHPARLWRSAVPIDELLAPLDEFCVSVTLKKGSELPNWVPIIGGKYGFEVDGEGCASQACELELSGNLGVEVEFTKRVKGSGSASVSGTWQTEPEECKYVFSSASASLSAGASGSLPLWSPAVGIPGVTVEIGGNLSGQANGSLQWAAANFPGWPTSGQVDLTASAGPYGTVNFFDVVEATLSGSGSVTGRYSPPASFQFAGWCLEAQAEASTWILTFTWTKSWGPCPGIRLAGSPMLVQTDSGQVVLLALPATKDDVPVSESLLMTVAASTGTGSVYEGTPVLANSISSDLNNDGKAAVASSSSEVLAAWTKDSADPNQAVGSSVVVAAFEGNGWSALQEVQAADYFNRDTTLAFDANDVPLLLWASAPATVTLSSPVTDVVEAIANSDIFFSRRLTEKTWTAPASVASLPGQDRSVQVAANDSGQAVAAWINSQAMTNTIVSAFWDGAAWSAPLSMPVTDALRSLAVAFAGSTPLLAWAQGVDGDPLTIDDLAIHYAAWNGAAWSAPARITKPEPTRNVVRAAVPRTAALAAAPGRERAVASQVHQELSSWLEVSAGRLQPATGARSAAQTVPQALLIDPPFDPPEECCATPTPTPTGMPTPTPTPEVSPVPTVPTIPPLAKGAVEATSTPAPTSVYVGPAAPDEKIGTQSSAQQPLLRTQDTIWYALHFENLAAAGRAVQQVTIVDPLDDDLDWSTFRFEGVAFGDQVIPITAGDNLQFLVRRPIEDYRPDVSQRWWLEISGEIDQLDGEVRWSFRTLDPATGQAPADPLAGFLPPNDAGGRGEGLVAFSVRLRKDRTSCPTLANQAAIAFDDEVPVPTNAVFNETAQRYDFFDPSGVGIEDVQMVAGRWGMDSADLAWNDAFDADGDGSITVTDIIMLAADWGEACL